MNPFQAFRGRVSWSRESPLNRSNLPLPPNRKPPGHMSRSIHWRGVSSCSLVLFSATVEQEQRSFAMLLHCICW